MRQPVDLSAHINLNVAKGGPADFQVSLKPLHYRENGSFTEVPRRFAVVRKDTGAPLAVVSDRYSIIPHKDILDIAEEASRSLDLGPVPRGVYVDRQGARMRAVFKFPALAQPVLDDDDICPCLMIQNTYDGTSRVAIQIGAFRFVCTNLAVGGGGIFAGGFMAVHVGAIAIEQIAGQLSTYLSDFSRIVGLYREWARTRLERVLWQKVLGTLPMRAGGAIASSVEKQVTPSVFSAYNAATDYATHRMRSARAAFDLLGRINRTFQTQFPASN